MKSSRNLHRNGNGLGLFNTKTTIIRANSQQEPWKPFVMVPFGFFRLLTRDPALLLAYLINHHNQVENRYGTNANFYVLQELIQDQLGMSIERQTKSLDKLRDEGLIRYRLESYAERWRVEVKYRKIVSALEFNEIEDD
jgi:hypothetical protein